MHHARTILATALPGTALPSEIERGAPARQGLPPHRRWASSSPSGRAQAQSQPDARRSSRYARQPGTTRLAGGSRAVESDADACPASREEGEDAQRAARCGADSGVRPASPTSRQAIGLVLDVRTWWSPPIGWCGSRVRRLGALVCRPSDIPAVRARTASARAFRAPRRRGSRCGLD